MYQKFDKYLQFYFFLVFEGEKCIKSIAGKFKEYKKRRFNPHLEDI